MKKLYLAVFVSLLAGTAAYSQSTTEAKPTQPKTITISEAQRSPAPSVKPVKKRGPVFRPTKDQIKQAQAILSEKSLYSGDASGTYNDDTRAAIRTFQKDSGLKVTGTLNRVTLEKMNISLTDRQKAIPATVETEIEPEKTSGPSTSGEPKPKKPAIFRATKDQIKEAQQLLRNGSMYDGEQTGKLDDATRDGLRKYQEANGLKVTGTLNRVTLEKMGVTLTETQKTIGEAP